MPAEKYVTDKTECTDPILLAKVLWLGNMQGKCKRAVSGGNEMEKENMINFINLYPIFVAL